MQKPHNRNITEMFHCAKTPNPWGGNKPKSIISHFHFFFTLLTSCLGLSIIVYHVWHRFSLHDTIYLKPFNHCVHNLLLCYCGCSPTQVLSSCPSCSPAEGQRQRISPWTSSQPYWQWAREHVLESTCMNTNTKKCTFTNMQTWRL